VTPEQIAAHWLRLVVADAKLSPYLIGVDLGRLGAHLTASLAAALGGGRGRVRRLVRPGPCPRRNTGGSWTTWPACSRRSTCRESASQRWSGDDRRALRRAAAQLAEDDARLLVAALSRHADTDDPAERAALRTVLGHAARYFDLRPHADVIARLTGCALPTGTGVGDGPPWRPAEVLAQDRPCGGVTVVTVRPWRRLHWRPGQAVPVSLPHQPCRWRWYSRANATAPSSCASAPSPRAPSPAASSMRYAPVTCSTSARPSTPGSA
jgi:hypothetical protein